MKVLLLHVAVAAVALMQVAGAAAGSASTEIVVRIECIPSREQSLKAAQIQLRHPDGRQLALTAEQKARYIRDPSSILTLSRPGGEGPVVLRVEY